MRLSDSFLEQLRANTDIESVISPYVNLRRRGKNLVGLCPFHNEKTPSFTVYPENGSFYCFGCGVGGDVITFVRRMENLDYMEAVKQLADRAGMALPEDGYDDTLAKKRTAVLAANRAAAKFFHSQLFTDRGRHALNYFLDRGLTMETIRTLAWALLRMTGARLKITSMNRALTIFCSRARISCAAATKTEKYLITTTSATA